MTATGVDLGPEGLNVGHLEQTLTTPDDEPRAYSQEGDVFYASKKALKSADEVAGPSASYNRGDDRWRKAAGWKVLRRG